MCGRVMKRWSCDVTDHMGGVGRRAIHSWGVSTGLEGPPVGGRGEAGVVGGVMGEVSRVRMRRGRSRRQVGTRGRSFIRQVQNRGRGLLRV